MKLVAVLALLVSLALAIGWRWHGQGRNASRAETGTVPGQIAHQAPTARSATLGVEQFMKNVDAHRGPVLIEGVVRAASAEKRVFAIIDPSEYEHCGVTTCAAYTLPVSWSGAMPLPKALVRVSGQVKEISGKMILVAVSVQATTRPEASK